MTKKKLLKSLTVAISISCLSSAFCFAATSHSTSSGRNSLGVGSGFSNGESNGSSNSVGLGSSSSSSSNGQSGSLFGVSSNSGESVGESESINILGEDSGHSTTTGISVFSSNGLPSFNSFPGISAFGISGFDASQIVNMAGEDWVGTKTTTYSDSEANDSTFGLSVDSVNGYATGQSSSYVWDDRGNKWYGQTSTSVSEAWSEDGYVVSSINGEFISENASAYTTSQATRLGNIRSTFGVASYYGGYDDGSVNMTGEYVAYNDEDSLSMTYAVKWQDVDNGYNAYGEYSVSGNNVVAHYTVFDSYTHDYFPVDIVCNADEAPLIRDANLIADKIHEDMQARFLD